MLAGRVIRAADLARAAQRESHEQGKVTLAISDLLGQALLTQRAERGCAMSTSISGPGMPPQSKPNAGTLEFPYRQSLIVNLKVSSVAVEPAS